MSFSLVKKIQEMSSTSLWKKFCEVSTNDEKKKTSSSAMKMVLEHLASCKNHKEPSHPICPSISTITTRTGLSKDTIIRAISGLLKVGILIKTKDNSSLRKPNYYQINEDIVDLMSTTSSTVRQEENFSSKHSLVAPCHQLAAQRDKTSSMVQPQHSNSINKDICGESSPQNKHDVDTIRNTEQPLENPKHEQEAARRQPLRSDLTAKQPFSRQVVEKFTADQLRLNLKMKSIAVTHEIDPTWIRVIFDNFTGWWAEEAKPKNKPSKSQAGWERAWTHWVSKAPKIYHSPQPGSKRVDEVIMDLTDYPLFLELIKNPNTRYRRLVDRIGGIDHCMTNGFPLVGENPWEVISSYE